MTSVTIERPPLPAMAVKRVYSVHLPMVTRPPAAATVDLAKQANIKPVD